MLTGGKIAAEIWGGLVLTLFVIFFLIKDGDRIWAWLIGALRAATARRWTGPGGPPGTRWWLTCAAPSRWPPSTPW